MWQLVTRLASNHLVRTLGISMGVNWVGWAAASVLHTEKFYDLTGSLTFILLSSISHGQSKMTVRQNLHSWMIFAWACRLGTFLFMRVLKDGQDKRFNEARDNPSKFFVFWSLQGVWVWLTLLPTLILNTERRNPALGGRDYLGYGLWLTGFLIEVTADMQKSIFKADPANEGKFITSGLWSLSRHPNYFGEIMLWAGLYVSSSSVFRGTQYMSVISPLFIYLLISRLSGVPLLEKSGMERWGKLPEYQKYLKEVPELIPFTKPDYDTEVYTVTLYWRVIFRRDYKKKYFQDKESSWKSDMMMMEDTRRQVAMGDMVHDMLIDRPPSPARMEYSLNFRSDKHARSTLTELNMIRKHHELCDVMITVGGRKIYAHKVILAACSPYFRAMFTGALSESSQTEVTIRDVDETAMDILIDFCYTSSIVVEENNVQTLLPAACLLQLAEIQDVCCEFLKRQLDPSNCLGIRAFADTHACRDLLRIADKFTQHNFQEVMEHEEFLLLPLPQLIDIISSDELNVRSEEQVFQAVMNWIKYNMAERRGHLSHVLQHVRMPLLTPKFLVGTVGSDILIKSDDACRDLVDEAKNYLLLPQERPLMQGPRTRPRKPIRKGEVLFAVGGWCSGDAIASVERYDPQTGEWKMVSPMSKRRCGVGVAVLNDLLYAVGGHDGQSYLNSIERYDPQTNQWSSDVAPTSSCRTSVGVAVLDGFLYAVGGQDGVSCLNHVERYDPKENKWTKVASMNTRRLGVAVAVLNGYLFAIGGSDGQCPLNTVERYDPRANKWTVVSSMSTRRKHLGCAVFNNMIYAVGGRDDATELSSAEIYNPTSGSWSPMVAMMSRRSGVGLAVVNGQLFAVGGFDGTTYLKTIEVYDAEANNWKLCGSMNFRRLGGGVGVVRMPQSDSRLW